MSAKNKEIKSSEDEGWYYDACTLDYNEDTYYEIINKRGYNHKTLISHLAIGEAYGNCFNKSEEAADKFITLIKKLRQYISIIGNDNIECELEKTRSKFPRLTITDAVHLATAIRYNCQIFRTTDSDLWKLPKDLVKALASECGREKFNISEMKRKTS